MNSCNEVRDGLIEYLDGRLTGRAMQEIDAHHCRAAVMNARLSLC